ncbi:MAG TPA: nuclear transport factor 2 family protein [Solirubrobacterales bacterium]|nr:nuclear transport factor 2 family protein [Solirubrobacterales bacterium]
MTQENVEVVRRAYEAFNAGGSVDEVMERVTPLLDPDAEWVNPPEALERGTRVGIDGWRAAFENVKAGLGQSVRFEIEELVGQGDLVLATGKAHISGTTSGVETVSPEWGAIFTVKERRIRRYEWSTDPVGLRARFAATEPPP